MTVTVKNREHVFHVPESLAARVAAVAPRGVFGDLPEVARWLAPVGKYAAIGRWAEAELNLSMAERVAKAHPAHH